LKAHYLGNGIYQLLNCAIDARPDVDVAEHWIGVLNVIFMRSTGSNATCVVPRLLITPIHARLIFGDPECCDKFAFEIYQVMSLRYRQLCIQALTISLCPIAELQPFTHALADLDQQCTKCN
jgi:hypothetical protein